MKQCVIIINPKSGKTRKIKFIEKIKVALLKYGYEPTIFLTQYKGHAREIVRNLETVDLVISVGGDGTFNEVMHGNFERKERLLLSHIPIGTTNDIGAMYGYSKNIFKNFERLLNGVVREIDICTINGLPFTYCASFGKFTNVSYETPRKLKKNFGYLAYLIYGLKEIGGITNTYGIEYKIDDQTYHGKYSFMLISNANRIAGINHFYKDVKLDDNQFEVLFCDIIRKKDIIKSLYYLMRNDITSIKGFTFYKGSELKICFEEPLPKGWSIDGEELKDNQKVFDIQIVRNIKILIPTKNIKELFVNEE